MATNTGKSAEKEFEARIASFGKRAYLHRFDDASSFFALAGKAGNVASQPSDYLLILDGRSEFCEVKSTANPTSFPFSMLRPTQLGRARQITAAGGTYTIYVKSISSGGWFVVPFNDLAVMQKAGKSSAKWAELQPWNL